MSNYEAGSAKGGANGTREPKRHTLLDVMGYTADRAKELANANSVLGEKIEIEGMTIYPLSRLSVGMAGGAAEWENTTKGKRTNPAGAGTGITRTPLAFLVVQDGTARLLNVSPETAPAGGHSLSALVAQIAGKATQGKEEKKNRKQPGQEKAR